VSEGHCRRGGHGKCGRIGWIVSHILTIAFVSFTSAVIVSRILMPPHPPSSDSSLPPPPPPPFLLALILVVAVVFAELGLLFLARKALVSMGICSAAPANSDENGPSPRYSSSSPPSQQSGNSPAHRWNITGLYDQFARPTSENLYTPLRAAPDVEMSANRNQQQQQIARGQPVQVPNGYVYIAPTNSAQSVHYI